MWACFVNTLRCSNYCSSRSRQRSLLAGRATQRSEDGRGHL